MKKYAALLVVPLFSLLGPIAAHAATFTSTGLCQLGVYDTQTSITLDHTNDLTTAGFTTGDLVDISSTADPADDGTYTLTAVYPSADGNAALVSPAFPSAVYDGHPCTFTTHATPPPPPPPDTRPHFLFPNTNTATNHGSSTEALAAAVEGTTLSFADLWPIALALVGLVVAFVSMEYMLALTKRSVKPEKGKRK